MSTQCLAGQSCRAPHITADGKREGRYIETEDSLCLACETHFRSAIKQLPDDWAALRAAVGERQVSDGPKINSTRTPSMPISARKDALMAAITETATRAAEIIADALNTFPAAGRTAPELKIDGKPTQPQPDTPAWRAEQITRPTDEHTVTAAIALIEPNITLLAAHGQGIDPDADDYDGQLDHRIWNDNGEHAHGEPFEHVAMTGIDIVNALVDLHNQTRAELGKTHLRHRLSLPCPQCGGRVGINDGQTIVNCDDCNGAWTERDYKWFAGLVIDERRKMEIIEMLKYLLAEAYSRLDSLTEAMKLVSTNPALDTDPKGGRFVLELVDLTLKGHLPPADRTVASDRETAEQRQDTEDTWDWGERPERYTPPKRKRTQPNPPPEHPIHPGSLSTLVDIDADAVINGAPICPDCNLIHAGECP